MGMTFIKKVLSRYRPGIPFADVVRDALAEHPEVALRREIRNIGTHLEEVAVEVDRLWTAEGRGPDLDGQKPRPWRIISIPDYGPFGKDEL